MDGGSQICDGPTSRQPAGQPNLEKMAAGRGPQGARPDEDAAGA